VREETQLEPICVYCKQPITDEQRPCKGFDSGEKAHLTCYVRHMHDDEKKPAP
jgi:hypothetical protein